MGCRCDKLFDEKGEVVRLGQAHAPSCPEYPETVIARLRADRDEWKAACAQADKLLAGAPELVDAAETVVRILRCSTLVGVPFENLGRLVRRWYGEALEVPLASDPDWLQEVVGHAWESGRRVHSEEVPETWGAYWEHVREAVLARYAKELAADAEKATWAGEADE